MRLAPAVEVLPVRRLARRPDVVLTLPGSKSLTNRALLAAALASGRSVLTGALFSDDTEAMLSALSTLGLVATADRETATIVVDGWEGQVPAGPASLGVGQAGTAARFLPPLLALGPGPYVIDGSAQMRARPMAGL
ncbi:MAG: 3-phosphoshikimate 1-carboxyvinyltransferase, partial [Actinomycetota bacterium]|nr:3-phosphoshikimate 1-carboxyvinyltransferase [Actinomycetota bacterium]